MDIFDPAKNSVFLVKISKNVVFSTFNSKNETLGLHLRQWRQWVKGASLNALSASVNC